MESSCQVEDKGREAWQREVAKGRWGMASVLLLRWEPAELEAHDEALMVAGLSIHASDI